MAEVCTPKAQGVAAAQSASKLPKPKMRGLVTSQMKKGLVYALVGSVACAWYWKVYHMDYRQRKTKEYFATYDPVKEFERQRDLGLFQWAKPKPGAKPLYKFHEMEIEFE